VKLPAKCSSAKTRYLDAHAAHRALRTLCAADPQCPLKAFYPCKECGCWHLTKKRGQLKPKNP